MKKSLLIFVLLSVFVFALTPVSHASSYLDLSTLSTDELLSIRDSINAELSKRNFKEKSVIVPKGIYTVGTDIPAGAYTLTSKENLVTMAIYDQNDNLIFSSAFDEGEILGKVELKHGCIVKFTGMFVFETYKGLGF